MDKMRFGEILRQTRERKGLDLNETARRLRIRPDILDAIEAGNFAAMPPRGYARNMVNGYARYLGLNPTEITGMYLDELYAYQVDYETSRMRPTGIDMPDTPSSARAAQRASTRSTNRRTYYEREEREAVLAQNIEQTNRTRGRRSSDRRERLYPEGRTHQARGTALPDTHYTNLYSGPGPMGFLQTHWRLIVAALVALIVLALILSQVFSCSRKQEEEVETVPVTGVASSDIAAIEQPKAPTSFTMEYTVEDGGVSWIEVYVDGQLEVGEAVTGPQTKSFTSSDTIQFITANPSPVKIKIDGSDVQMETDETGVVNMTWSFSEILAQWLKDHPGAKASSTLGSSSSGASGSDAGSANTGDDVDALQDAAQAQLNAVEEQQQANADAATSTDAAAGGAAAGAVATDANANTDAAAGGAAANPDAAVAAGTTIDVAGTTGTN